MSEVPERPTLVLVGGFLGAGKTTLLLAAARLLCERGVRAAVITNDQGAELVDTRMAEAAGIAAGEVAGACFCCRFSSLIEIARSLRAAAPRVIFAEPVGSCVDLAATVLRPLQQHYAAEFNIAPLSVLVDPSRVADLLRPDADAHLTWLFQNQIAEADLVVFTKADLYPEPPSLPGIAARRVSARSGQGVSAWLDEILCGHLNAGAHRLKIDYGRYAAAEAALGWLNWEAEVRLSAGLPPALLVGPLLERLDRELTATGAAIVHLKIFDRVPDGYLRAGICGNGEEPSIDGDLIGGPARRHEILLNLRARALPSVLASAVQRAASEIPGRVNVRHQQAFQPSPPKPEYPPIV